MPDQLSTELVEKFSGNPYQDVLMEVMGALRPYQIRVLHTLITNPRHLNYMEPGMGKSLTTLAAIVATKAFPCVIVCSKSAMYVLEEEIRKWFGMEAIIYVGKPKKRQELWKQFVTGGYKFIITNYSLAKELGLLFGVLKEETVKSGKDRGTIRIKATPPGTQDRWHIGGFIADEIQLGGLFNHKTVTYDLFRKFTYGIKHVYLLTGTPYRRGMVDTYGPLSVIRPDVFDNYWGYIGKYALQLDSPYGKTIERSPRNVIEFREMIRKYAVIMKKADHVKDLPEKQRAIEYVGMSDEQARVYKELSTDLFSETDSGDLIITPNILAASVKLRLLLACPQALGLISRGGAIDALCENAAYFQDNDKPFVVFTPFKKAVPFILKALQEDYPGIKSYVITGGLTPKEFSNQWMGFQNGRGFRVLICVVKSATSYHATCADTAFFVGFEWDFNQNIQAEDRLNRIGQKSAVLCRYLVSKDTIDEAVIRRLNEKKYVSDLILSEQEAFEAIIKRRK